MDKWIIRTSDRISFKNCRQEWDWGSKLRQNLEPYRTDWNLAFGTAVHSGLEAYYDPDFWHVPQSGKLLNATTAFQEAWNGFNAEWFSEEDREQWAELLVTGNRMLQGYAEWAPTQDNFKPLYTEVEFEVPIKVPDIYSPTLDISRHVELPQGFWFNQQQELLYNDLPVVYQGKIDLVVEDEDGFIWIIDHKTTAKWDSIEDFLPMNEQVGSYCWAVQEMLGVKVAGFIYSQLKKSYPVPPRVLQSGQLSKDKQQSTTYDLYMQELTERGLPTGKYADFLTYIQENPPTFFRRFQVHKTQQNLRLLGERICLESIDMLRPDLLVYPTPSQFRCGRCAFKSPCMAMQDGADYEWLIKDLYRHRESDTANGAV